MNKPRILVIAFATFFPPISGGRIVNYNNALFLSQYFNLEILFPAPWEEQDKEGLKQLSRIAKIHTIDIGDKKASSRARILSDCLRSLVDCYPMRDIHRFYEDRRVQELIREDFLFIQLNTSLWYHPELKNRRGGLILLQHNWEYEYWKQMAAALFAQKMYFRALYYRLVSRKVRRQEVEAISDAQTVVVLSERECDAFRHFYHRDHHCYAVAQGINIREYDGPWFSPVSTSGAKVTLVYVGSLNMPQHAAGVIDFVQRVYPQLKAGSHLQYHLNLVGPRPPSQLQKLAAQDSSITLAGSVDDVKSWIACADIYIVPMLHGSGIRFKIMEAMAMGKPVVSTYKGAEGLKLPEGIVLTQTLEEFIHAIEQIASNPEKREQMGHLNRAYAVENFDCEKIFHKEMLPLYQRFSCISTD